MSLPYRTLAAGLILCGTGLSSAALPLASGAVGFKANPLIPVEWRNPDQTSAAVSGNSSARELRYSRYGHYRHHRHHRYHRRGRHHHRFFFF